MAAIYGNNLHEKLVGVAISEEYLKYNTPFCDLVDDPEWAVDINLALDYNSATTGNLPIAFPLFWITCVMRTRTVLGLYDTRKPTRWWDSRVSCMTYDAKFITIISNACYKPIFFP